MTASSWEVRAPMRAIPIDSYLAEVEDGRAATGSKAAPATWSGIVAAGRAARAAADGGVWRIGQLAHLVERHYRSGALKKFAEDIGEAYSSVRRYSWVVGRYPPEARARFSSLSFSHLQVVAGMNNRISWLQRAERGGWSVERLTRESRDANGIPTRGLAALRKPVETLARRIADLHESEGALSKEERQGLTRALSELAAEVDRMLVRLSSGSSSSDLRVRHAVNGNGHGSNGHGANGSNGNGRARSNGNGLARSRERVVAR